MPDSDQSKRAATCAVAIMAKESRAGTCKTRLVPPLTHEEAAEANTCFLKDVAGNIVEASVLTALQGYAAYHPLGSEQFFEAILPPGFLLLPPREPSIGRSLFHSARDLLAMGWQSACLVNSDSPTLPTRYLAETALHLGAPGDRVVLGPSDDGGYYLIGLKAFHARLFEDIDWSTERVFAQTCARAAEIGLETVILPEWYDVDDGACFARLRRELLETGTEREPGFHAPNTTGWLLQRLSAEAARRLADKTETREMA